MSIDGLEHMNMNVYDRDRYCHVDQLPSCPKRISRDQASQSLAQCLTGTGHQDYKL